MDVKTVKLKDNPDWIDEAIKNAGWFFNGFWRIEFGNGKQPTLMSHPSVWRVRYAKDTREFFVNDVPYKSKLDGIKPEDLIRLLEDNNVARW